MYVLFVSFPARPHIYPRTYPHTQSLQPAALPRILQWKAARSGAVGWRAGEQIRKLRKKEKANKQAKTKPRQTEKERNNKQTNKQTINQTIKQPKKGLGYVEYITVDRLYDRFWGVSCCSSVQRISMQCTAQCSAVQCSCIPPCF